VKQKLGSRFAVYDQSLSVSEADKKVSAALSRDDSALLDGECGASWAPPIVRSVRIMILETTSGGRSTGSVPLAWEVTRYKYIQGRSKHEETRKKILRNSSPIEDD